MHVNILAFDRNAEDSQNIRVGSPGGDSLVRGICRKMQPQVVGKYVNIEDCHKSSTRGIEAKSLH